MAAVPLFSVIICQDSIQPTIKSSSHCGNGTISENLFPSQKDFRCFSSSNSFNSGKRWLSFHSHTELFSKTGMKNGIDDYMVNNRRSMPFQNLTQTYSWKNYAMGKLLKSSSNDISRIDKSFFESYTSTTRGNERRSKCLDSYYSMLHDDLNEEHTSCMPMSDFGTMSDSREYPTDPSSSMGERMRSIETVDQLKAKTGLGSLESYFEKLRDGMQRKITSPSSTEDDAESRLIRLNAISEDYYEKTAGAVNTHNNAMPLESMDDETVPVIFGENKFQDSQPYDDTPDFYLINLLASVDIAVFLFEIASPIRSSDVEQLSLPLIYGAKINKLILDGEWWRILTPMFLVQD